jgi:hypothetical protein
MIRVFTFFSKILLVVTFDSIFFLVPLMAYGLTFSLVANSCHVVGMLAITTALKLLPLERVIQRLVGALLIPESHKWSVEPEP